MLKQRLLQLAVLLPVVAVVVWLVTDTVEPLPRGTELVARSPTGGLQRLAITSATQAIVIERGEGGWRMTSPIEAALEDNAMPSFLEHLGQLQVLGRAPAGSDLSLFGLSPPAFRIDLGFTDHDEALLTGKRNSFNGQMYIQREGEDVALLTDSAFRYQISRDVMNWRDKRIAPFEASLVRSLEIRVGGRRYTLEKRDEHFEIIGESRHRADDELVQRVLSHVANLRAARFVTEVATPEDLERHGLDQPTATVRVQLSGREPFSVFLSEGAGDGSEVAATRGLGSPLAVVTQSRAVDPFRTSEAHWRDHRLVRFEREEVTGIELQRGDESCALQLTPQGWRLDGTSPAKASEVFALLYKVWTLSAEQIVAEAASAAQLREHGLQPPMARIVLIGADSTLAEITFGDPDGENIWATVAGSQRLDLVAASRLDALIFRRDHYLEH